MRQRSMTFLSRRLKPLGPLRGPGLVFVPHGQRRYHWSIGGTTGPSAVALGVAETSVNRVNGAEAERVGVPGAAQRGGAGSRGVCVRIESRVKGRRGATVCASCRGGRGVGPASLSAWMNGRANEKAASTAALAAATSSGKWLYPAVGNVASGVDSRKGKAVLQRGRLDDTPLATSILDVLGRNVQAAACCNSCSCCIADVRARTCVCHSACRVYVLPTSTPTGLP